MEISDSKWVFVMIQHTGNAEQIVGQTDQEKQINFIPVFLTKEAALQAARFFPLQKPNKLEIQAIIFEDLSNYARDNNFQILILDENGKILDSP